MGKDSSQAMSGPQKPSRDYHQKTTLRLRVTDEHKRQIAAIIRERGYDDISSWVVAMANRCQSERIPESQGDVKKIIPEEVAMVAAEACTLLAGIRQETAHTVFQTTGNRDLRRHYNGAAELAHDAAGFFATVLDEIRYRKHVLAAGIREPRHRTKAQSPTPGSESASQAKKSP